MGDVNNDSELDKSFLEMMKGDFIGFVKLVRRLRDNQKEFFKTRDRLVLRRAKELEKRVDAETRNIMRFYSTAMPEKERIELQKTLESEREENGRPEDDGVPF